MLRNLMVLMSTVLLLCAVFCRFSSASDQLKEPFITLPHHYSQFDVHMGWNVTTDSTGTSIEGIIQNVRYAQMEQIEIWVSAVAADGKPISRTTNFVMPQRLNMGDMTSFSLKLPVAAIVGTKLIFTYKYEGSDGGDDGGVIRWMQSFDSAM